MDIQNTYKAHTTIITDKSLAMELADWGFAIAWEFKRPEKIKEGGGIFILVSKQDFSNDFLQSPLRVGGLWIWHLVIVKQFFLVILCFVVD